MRELRINRDRLVAEVRYGSDWVLSLFERDAAGLDLHCEVIDPALDARVRHSQETNLRQRKVLASLRSAILHQVQEKLPFDEPKTEWGQQDGHLLQAWRRAYDDGKDHYTFNFDRYDVFTPGGAPMVPQVCIDFVTHTFERASGTWWRSKGEPRERTSGRLDLDPMINGSRRQIYSFLDFVKKSEHAFEVKTLPVMERVPYKLKRRFYDYLATHRDDFVPGDLIVIRGYAPYRCRLGFAKGSTALPDQYSPLPRHAQLSHASSPPGNRTAGYPERRR
jgi:hypothetical protein